MKDSEEEKNVGTGRTKFGLDPYIIFDKTKGEIRMEIPMDVLFDPDKNKALGEVRKPKLIFNKELGRYVQE